MYLYFDVNGNLKEIINYPIREGDDNVDKIYVYMEPSTNVVTEIDSSDYGNYDFEGNVPTINQIKVRMLPTIYNVWMAAFRYTDGEDITEPETPLGDDIDDSNVIKQIPFDEERDLKFFKYYQYYQFIVIDITNEITIEDGRVDCSICMINTSLNEDEDGYIKYLDVVSFFIQDSVVIKDIQISTAQYEYLYAQIQLLKGTGDYVPYTGATKNVNLGNHELTANKINGNILGVYLEAKPILGVTKASYKYNGISPNVPIDNAALLSPTLLFPTILNNETLATQEWSKPHVSSDPPTDMSRLWFEIDD